MEEKQKNNILDTESESSLQKKLWTIRLLLVGGGMVLITFLIATLWEKLGLDSSQTIWLGLSMMVSFGVNLAGFIIGITERKKNRPRALVGIIGNLVFILFFVFIVSYAMNSIPTAA